MFNLFKKKEEAKEVGENDAYMKVLDDMFAKGQISKSEYEIEKSMITEEGFVPYPTDSYVVMSGYDFRVPIQVIPWKALYDLAYYSDVLRTVIKVITDEVFRNGMFLEERFMSKCTRCGAEFEDVKIICPYCGGVVRRPDERERLKANLWLEKYVNGFDEKLIDVLKQCDTDVNVLDNSFIVLIKDYIYDKNKNLVGFKVKEVVRGSPLKMRLVWSKYGLGRDARGNFMYVCPEHRTKVVKKSERGRYYCEKCGRELLPAYYVQFAVPGSKTQVFYAKGEVYHLKRWSNMQGYGFPPTLTVILKAITLLKMDRHMYLQYALMRSPKGLLVIRGKENEIRRAWEWLMQKARENPNMIYPLTISGSNDAKKLVEWVDFNLKPAEMEWGAVREEFRKNIGCYDEETEILIRGKGYVKYTEIEEGDEVLAFDKESGKLEWKKINEKFVYDYEGDMYNVGGIIVSPEHRFIVKNDDGNFEEIRIGEVEGRAYHFPFLNEDDEIVYEKIEVSKKVKYVGKIWDINIGGGYFVVRRNGRVAISGNSVYGVLPMFQGDVSTGGGLNNEGLQITVTNRTVAESQRVWNEFLKWFSEQIGLKDWYIKLKPNEEKDMKAELDRIEQRVRIMQELMQMGFEVELVEGIDGLDFRVKEGKPKAVGESNVMMQGGNEMVNGKDVGINNPLQKSDEDVVEKAMREAVEKLGIDEFLKKLGSLVDEYSNSPYRPRKRRKENKDIPDGSDVVSENTNKDASGGVSSSIIGTASEVVDNPVYGNRKKKREIKDE